MTNEQKAVIIATRDGWQFDKQDGFWEHPTYASVDVLLLTRQYTRNLNYLVPVAVKVRRQLEKGLINVSSQGYYLYCKVLNEFDMLHKPEGTYQPLFDAVYNAIVYLENQNQ